MGNIKCNGSEHGQNEISDIRDEKQYRNYVSTFIEHAHVIDFVEVIYFSCAYERDTVRMDVVWIRLCFLKVLSQM